MDMTLLTQIPPSPNPFPLKPRKITSQVTHIFVPNSNCRGQTTNPSWPRAEYPIRRLRHHPLSSRVENPKAKLRKPPPSELRQGEGA